MDTRYISRGVPSDIRVNHDTYAHMRITAGLKPMPFCISSPMLPTDNEVKSRLIAGLEPLLFDNEVPTDEFANYIDVMIQVLSVD